MSDEHPRCSECEPSTPHHWTPNGEDESVGAPDFICKHCDVGYAWMCIGCDVALSYPDTFCADCEEEEANESCSFCGGRRFFMEPTSFGDHPDGMQRIACPECGGRSRSKEGRGT